MNREAEAVLKQALDLSEAERASIAGALLESLEPETEVGIEEAWRLEVAARVAQLDAGDVKTVPWEEVRDRLFARLSARRAG